MSEPKVIELTEDEAEKLFAKGCNSLGEAYMMMGDFRNGGVTLKPSQPKLVHLSDLPSLTRVKVYYQENIYCNYFHDGRLFENINGWGTLNDVSCLPLEDCTFELTPSEWQVWRNVNHWPDGVEVEIEYYSPNLHTSPDRNHVKMNASEVADFVKHRDYIIGIRCTGRLLDGAKLVP